MSDLPHPSPENPATPTPGAGLRHERVVEAIMFTDIEGSVGLEQALGTERYAALLTRHGELFYEALGERHVGQIEKHTGDGYMARFDRPSEATEAALHFQWLLGRETWETKVRVRIGIHQGEILRLHSDRQMPSSIGAPVNLAARVMAMAEGGQILLTRAVFDSARQFIKEIPGLNGTEQPELRWEAHGAYLVKGLEEPVEIFQVGERKRAPFHAPKDTPTSRRSVSAEEEATLGWRPAKGLEIPKRPGWVLERALGEGGFGEVWLAQNRSTRERRVFKFCFDAVRLRSFKREVLLFRLIRQALGPRADIATLYDVQLETAPFFLEGAFCPGGILSDWVKERARAGREVPLAQRLELVAQIGRALGAAHSVGIIHKDVKPSNIFVEEAADGTPRTRLADFGIGVIADRSALEALDLTYTIDLTTTGDSSRSGTRMYSAPEYMTGAPPSIPGDVYSLGVLLYQMVISDFARPVGPGWRRDVKDALLAEEIAACVDIDPARRPDSAVQVAENLETLEQRRAALLAAAEARRRQEEQERAVKKQRRRLRAALFAAGVAVAIIGALCVAVFIQLDAKKAALQHAADIAAERETARDHLYVADLQSATEDMMRRRAEAARELLERHRPAPGGRDRRGWEWFFADSVLNTSHLARPVSKRPLRALAVSGDEQSVAVAGEDGAVTLWSCATLEKTHTWDAGDAVHSLDWNAQSGMLAAGLATGYVATWDPATQLEKGRWMAHDGAVTSLDWHPFESVIMSGGADGVIACWMADGQPIREAQKSGRVRALEWKPEGNEIAVVLGEPARVLVGAAETLEEEHEFALHVEDSALAWRPGAYEIAIAMNGLPLRSWNPRTCIDSFWLPAQFTPGATAYAWSPSGAEIAVGGIDGKIVLADPHRRAESRMALYGHRGRVAALRWIGQRKERLLSVGEDGSLRAWEDLRRSPEITPIPFPAELADAQWHPHDDKLALLLAGDEVQIVNAATWSPEWSGLMPAPRDARTPFHGGRLAWSPDGRWIAAACAGRGAMAWRLEDGRRVALAGLEGATDLQWMPDARRLLARTPAGWRCATVESGESVALADTSAVRWMGGLGGERLGLFVEIQSVPHFVVADFPACQPKQSFALPPQFAALRTCALSPDRTRLAFADESGAVGWIDTRTGELRRPALAHAGPVKALAWHPAGDRIVTAGADGTVRLFNIREVAQNWVIEHKLSTDIAASGWSADGTRLMLTSMPERLVKIFDASNSYARARGDEAPPAESTLTGRLEQAGTWIARNPGEDFGWRALTQALRERRGEGENPEADLLLAAADLGSRGWFKPLSETPLSELAILQSWQGATLPRAVQVVQACARQQWGEVIALCGTRLPEEPGAEWFALAEAEALAQLGRREEAESANLEAWKAMRRRHGSADPGRLAEWPTPAGASSASLVSWANVRLTDEWNGGEKNNLVSLPAVLPQPEGYRFQCRDFIQLAGRNLRVTRGRMAARSTAWMPLGRSAGALSFLLASSHVEPGEPVQDVCIGSLFLLRANGSSATRIPLIYGRNVWDWWLPSSGEVPPPPEEAIAWRGRNPHADFHRRGLALYRLHWDAEPGQAPIVAVSMVSHARRPGPMLMAVEAR